MSELIQVQGAEIAGWWTLTAPAERSTDQAYLGSYSYNIATRKGLGDPEGLGVMTSPGILVQAARTYDLNAWIYELSVSDVWLLIEVDLGTGVWQEIGWVGPTWGASWQALSTIQITPVGSTIYLRFSTNDSALSVVNARFYLDEISLLLVPETEEEALARGLYDAYTALKTTLALLNGEVDGHWHDLGSRVLNRLILPTDSLEIRMPYVCAPFTGDVESFEPLAAGYKSRWRQMIFAFVEDTSAESDESKAVEAVAKLRDDLVKLILNNSTLGDAVQDVTIISTTLTAGWTKDTAYGELAMELEITQLFGEADLGSEA